MTALPEIAHACLTLICGLGVLYVVGVVLLCALACVLPDHTRLKS